MKLLKQVGIVFLGLFALALAGCSGGGDDGSGVQSTTGVALVPGGVTLGGPTNVAVMELRATKTVLLTNGNDYIDFTVSVKDGSSVPIDDETIYVASTGGNLSGSVLTTNADNDGDGDPDGKGLAKFRLEVGTEKVNRQITVSVSAGGLLRTQAVTISGTTLKLTATKYTTVQTNTDIQLQAELKDAGGTSLTGIPVTFSSTLGNTFNAVVPAVFDPGTYTGNTDAGLFSAQYVANLVGSDTVTVTGAGATARVSLAIDAPSFAAYHITTPLNNAIVGVSEDHPVTVQYLDAGGAPVLKTLTFTAGKGYFGAPGITSTTATIDGTGLATVTYSTGTTAGPAVITVTDASVTPAKSDSITLDVRATNPTWISLQASPSVIPVSVNGSVATSTLIATVRDASQQAVAGQIVNFNLLKGPGGGEYISPVSAVTDAGGVATATFTSGNTPSGNDGVEIVATVQGTAVTTVTPTKLTIGNVAASITIGASNKINTESIGGLEVAYSLPFSVIVSDAAGNPVENAVVSLAVFPVRFWTGGVASSLQVRDGGLFLNEDINRNGIFEAGEDGAIGLDPTSMQTNTTYWERGAEGTYAVVNATQTGNGRLDPANVVNILGADNKPPPVTTGPTGMAAFKLIYPKSYGGWIDVEITATTTVFGSTAVAKLESALAVKQGDTPYPESPFGYYPAVIGP